MRITRLERRTDERGENIMFPKCEAMCTGFYTSTRGICCKRHAQYRVNSGRLDEVLCHTHAAQVALTHLVTEGVLS